MAPQIKCRSCSGIFGPSTFKDRDTRICRFCEIIEEGKRERDQLIQKIEQGNSERDELRRELVAANGKIDSLSTELKTLREFTSANVGVAASTGEATPATTSTAVSPTNAPGSRDTHVFRLVRNNVRPKIRRFMPTTCQNRFQILTDTSDEEEEEVRLVGDSIVGGQLEEFCARAPNKRKRFCIRGGGVDDVIAAVDEVADQAPPNTMYVVHVGTNDVVRTRSEELIAKYKRLIQSFKEKSSRIIISGIIPRMGANHRFFNVASSTNRRLANLCNEEGIGFVDTWDDFYYDRTLFVKDGVHLNQVGSARFGRLLHEAVKEYRSKNGRACAQEQT